MNDIGHEKLVREFQKRRRTMLRYFGTAMLLIILSLLFTQASDFMPQLFGIGKKSWSALAVAQFTAAVVFALTGFFKYRCPRCEEILRGHDRYYLGVMLDPPKCPNCGLHFS